MLHAFTQTTVVNHAFHTAVLYAKQLKRALLALLALLLATTCACCLLGIYTPARAHYDLHTTFQPPQGRAPTPQASGDKLQVPLLPTQRTTNLECASTDKLGDERPHDRPTVSKTHHITHNTSTFRSLARLQPPERRPERPKFNHRLKVTPPPIIK